jgi:hypothetical protein
MLEYSFKDIIVTYKEKTLLLLAKKLRLSIIRAMAQEEIPMFLKITEVWDQSTISELQVTEYSEIVWELISTVQLNISKIQ